MDLTSPAPRSSDVEDPATPTIGAGIDFTDPHSPLAPYYLRGSHVAVVLLLGILFYFVSHLQLWHSDVWMHLCFGKALVEEQRLPERDTYLPEAYTENRYSHFYTLSQAGFYVVYHAGERLAGGDATQRMAGGVEALRLCYSLLVVVRALLLILALRRLGTSLPVASAGLLLEMALTAGNILILRPQVLGECFFAGLLVILSRPELSRRAQIGLPILFVLWANCHGSFLLGLALIFLFAVGRGWDLMRQTTNRILTSLWRDLTLRKLLLALATCFLAAGVSNPHFFGIYTQAFQLSQHPNIQELGEWNPLGLSPGVLFHLFFMLSLLGIVTTHLLSPRGLSATQQLVLLVFGIGVCWQSRMLNWWALVLPWAIVCHWDAILARLSWGWLRTETVPSLRKTILCGAVIVIAWMWSGASFWVFTGQPRPVEVAVSPATPWQLGRQLRQPDDRDAEWLPRLNAICKQNYPDGRFHGTIGCSETVGDYLCWHLAPEVPLTLHTHVHHIKPAHWQQMHSLFQAPPGWWFTLREMQVNMLVFEAELYPQLRDAVRNDKNEWEVLLDESDSPTKPGSFFRLFIALRRKPT